MFRNSYANPLFYPDYFWLGREDSNLRMVESKSAASMSHRICSAAITELRSRSIRYRAGESHIAWISPHHDTHRDETDSKGEQ